jgi:uncharacterized protein YqeY
MKSFSLDAISEEMRAAMKAAERTRVATLKLLMTAIKNAEVEKRGDLTEDEAISVVTREVKRREEAASEFRKGGREDRATVEEEEASILREWLPEQLSPDEIEMLVDQAVSEVGAASPSEMGRVMGLLMPKVKGKADGKLVSDLVKKKLGAG